MPTITHEPKRKTSLKLIGGAGWRGVSVVKRALAILTEDLS